MLKFFILLVLVSVLSACKVKQVSDYSGDNISVTDTTFKSNDLDKMIAPYKVEMESKMNKVIVIQISR